MNFTEWLRTKRGKGSPLGDLADDAACDRQWPSEATTPERFQLRLACAGACSAARATLDAAWREYERSQQPSARSLRRSRRALAAA